MHAWAPIGAATLAVALGLAAPSAYAADPGALPLQPRMARAWLGVAMDVVPAAAGALVKHVVRGSPAERGGIKEGDTILRLDGDRMGGPADVTRAVGLRAAGDGAVITVSRGGAEVEVRVSFAPRPSGDELLRMDHVGTFAPAWTGVEAVGSAPKSLAALRGRVVILDFWATWCGPCRLMAPRLSAPQARYGAQGLTVVGITTDAAEQAATFAARTEMKYGVVSDPNGDTSRIYGVSSLPTLFVLDRRGVVRAVEIGFDPSRDGEIDRQIRALLAEPVPAADATPSPAVPPPAAPPASPAPPK